MDNLPLYMDNLAPYMDILAPEYGNLGLTVVPVSVTLGRARFAKNLARFAKNLADLEKFGAAQAVPVLGGLWDFSLVGAFITRHDCQVRGSPSYQNPMQRGTSL